jgi:hypothetical protein
MERGVQIYVRSYSIPKDVESYRIHRMHSHCAPGLAQTTLDLSGFSGRLLEPDSAELLGDLVALDQAVDVYDVGRLRGRLRALSAGVWRTPAVVVGGRRYVGLDAARTALRSLKHCRPE